MFTDIDDPSSAASSSPNAWPSPPSPLSPSPTPSMPERNGSPRKRRRGATFAVVTVIASLIGGTVAFGITRSNSRSTSTASIASATTAAGRPSQTTVSGTAASPSLAPTGLDIHTLIDRVSPSVVAIEIGQQGAGGQVQPVAAGSGVVISADGLVVTNAHVVSLTDSRGRPFTNAVITATMADGTSRAIDVLGSSPENDIAILRLKDTSNLVAAVLGNSDSLRVGDDVVAIGNSLDLGVTPSVTKGIISAKNRTLDVDANTTLTGLLQTDAPINHGNSGGALVNAAGELIGIPSAGIPNAQNVGFAIAINTVKPLIDQLKSGNARVSPALSTAVLGVTVSRANNGVVVSGVSAGSGAEKAGIGVGDVVTAVDGKPVAIPTDLGSILKSHAPGDSVQVSILQANKAATVTVILGARGA
jgi:serine protease Do